LLINEIGDANYDALKSLVARDKLADKTYAELPEKLKSHRKLDQNISDYIAVLKKSVARCEYGD